MTPGEFGEELIDIMMRTVGFIFREEPITEAEWDTMTDRILRLAEQEKAKAQGGQTMKDKPQTSSKYTASDFSIMLAFELGYKACEKGKNFQQAFEDFKSDIFRDEPRKEQP